MTTVISRILGSGSPFELADAVLNGTPCRIFKRAPSTLNELYRRAERARGSVFLEIGEQSVTYGEVMQKASSLSLALQEHGIKVDMRVCIAMGNCPEWVVAFIAVTSLGATVVLTPAEAPVSQLVGMLNAACCSLVICDQAVSRKLSECGDVRARITLKSDSLEYCSHTDVSQRLLPGSDPSLSYFKDIDPEQAALIAFTSGTTQFPKGVISSHRAVLTGIMNMMLGGALVSLRNTRSGASAASKAAPASLVVSPLAHIAGYSQVLLMMMLAGKVVLMPSWQVDDTLRVIERAKVRSISNATPTMLRELLRADRQGFTLSSLASVGIHGSMLQESLLHEFNQQLPSVSVGTGYGMTETNGSIAVAGGMELINRPTTCGPALPSVDLRIVDSDGRDVRSGESGEIWVRGAMLMNGYCGEELETHVFEHGWLKSGDYGSIDSDGYLYLTDRAQDVISFNGSRIFCRDVERCVSNQKDIDEVSVIPFEESGSAEHLIVAIVCKKGTTFNASDIFQGVRSMVGSDCYPFRIVEFKRFPRTLSGKIDRRGILNQIRG